MTPEEWDKELVRSGRTERDPSRPRPTKPAKWTKAEEKSLRGTLDTFWLKYRPLDSVLSLSGPHRKEMAAKVREHLAVERLRTHAVLAGIREMRGLYAHRYTVYCETVGNALARPSIYGAEKDAFVARTLELAREEDQSQQAAEDLLTKVLDYGLPPGVLRYDPTTLG